nr:methylmalonyl-CoA mutase [Bacillota bacterium]
MERPSRHWRRAAREQQAERERYRPRHAIRFITAASLFDGHDAAINIIRRLLQDAGAEVIHLGHNRSVDEIVRAALQEDVQGIAVSSYQGGHMEFFKYMYDRLQEEGAGHIKIFGGGGGVIVPHEIAELERYGIAKIYSPEDGMRLGLEGMIEDMLRKTDFPTPSVTVEEVEQLSPDRTQTLARLITLAERAAAGEPVSLGAPLDNWPRILEALSQKQVKKTPVIGLTGTGGAGKSSLTDELVRRFLYDFPEKKVAILSVDPSKQRTGGALLGDRIRMNAIHHPNVFMRSLATRRSGVEVSDAVKDVLTVLKAAGFDLILLETSGIGQADSRVVELADRSIYVMTSDYGAASQLEKIEMLDYADLVAINKFDRRGSEDALRDVRKQYRRNHRIPADVPDEALPVFGTIASRFNDPGTTRFYHALLAELEEWTGEAWPSKLVADSSSKPMTIIPPERANYLREIVQTLKQEQKFVEEQVDIARRLYRLHGTVQMLEASLAGSDGEASGETSAAADALDALGDAPDAAHDAMELTKDTVNGSSGHGASEHDTEAALRLLKRHIRELEQKLHPECRRILEEWPKLKEKYQQDELVTQVRGKEVRQPLYTVSLSGTRIPRVVLPKYEDWGDILRWCLKENVPGQYPFTAGVFPLRRTDEEPRRMFAGEGTPERTNKRFHFLSKDDPAKRLSTAFDSVTLYGEDPDWRPDIFGKIGESGVSVCTLDDMKRLYEGFDLCHPQTSVSMTINGPAPIILAMFLNTAIDQQVDKFVRENGRQPTPEEYERIKAYTLQNVRGTVQADILKEDQGQNTCIFSIDFALKMMGDIQEYFIANKVRNYYSVSISGYHIAEAGANPITQLAFTLANGFTYVEYYLSRGMKVDDFAPNLSFFFSNGLDPEYTVIGRVARRIWAKVMKLRYGANERSQKLKYHIQTSGRSLHAQEMAFNDIRTTLQALMALYDNCNSLHTNAYDEAVTTPTEESVRRAMAIQMIINREMGLTKNENPWQGSFIIEELTDLVEEAVLAEFLRISDRGGVLGAMETQYQRSKIQEESMLYERKKHSGELPIIGVNTFLNPNPEAEVQKPLKLSRATREEKELQIRRLREFQEAHREEAPRALKRLQEVALAGGNIFEELMETVRFASLGQITRALYEVGGQYRRNM